MRTLFLSLDVIHFDWVLLGASLLSSSELSVPNTDVEKKKKSKGRKEERKKKGKVNFSPWAVIFTRWLLGTELTCHSPDVQICGRHPSEMSKHGHQRALSEPSCCGSAVPSLVFMATLFPWRRSYW